jgi:pimeloyl-ACP methyl ester carboxylesterase
MNAPENSQSNPAAEAVKRYRKIEEIIPSYWTQGALVANGIRQHYYRTGGDKPPLVLLHGFMEGALAWLKVARLLEPDYDVVMLDARGHGRSQGIASGFSQEALTEDAAGALRALKLEHTLTLGFSQGGGTGIHLADAYPQLVKALVVEGMAETPSGADFTQSEGYQRWYRGYLAWLEELKTQSHQERMLSALSQLPPGAPVPPEEEYVAWVENCANLDLDMVRLAYAEWRKLDHQVEAMTQALRRLTCPVLVMKSEFSPQSGAPKAVQEEASNLANVRVVRFINTGHLIHQEQFEPFIALVKQFFKGF